MIALTIDDLKNLIDQLERNVKHGSMCSYVKIDVKAHPNGRRFLEVEQPCCYRECFSSFYRYDEKTK